MKLKNNGHLRFKFHFRCTIYTNNEVGSAGSRCNMSAYAPYMRCNFKPT
jgi:hypothetical protein